MEVKLKRKQWSKNHIIILQECEPSFCCHLNNKATAQEICGGAQMRSKKKSIYVHYFISFFSVSVHTVSKFSFVGISDNISCSVYCFNMSRAHYVLYFIYEQKFKYLYNFHRMIFFYPSY